jgi:Putative auto-transporter adhesin, head GIN domain
MNGGPVESLKTEIREVGFFDAIDATDSYEIHIVCQKPLSVSLTALENIMPIVKTEVVNKTLFIKNTQRIKNEKITIDISMPTLRVSKSAFVR